MLGRAGEAQTAYADAVDAARGVAAGSYAKAFAAQKRLSEEQARNRSGWKHLRVLVACTYSRQL